MIPRIDSTLVLDHASVAQLFWYSDEDQIKMAENFSLTLNAQDSNGVEGEGIRGKAEDRILLHKRQGQYQYS